MTETQRLLQSLSLACAFSLAESGSQSKVSIRVSILDYLILINHEINATAAATQIHSSLLSISVGAVLLPAAFHFALSYGSQDKGEAQTTLKDQKEDILRMSHGVSSSNT